MSHVNVMCEKAATSALQTVSGWCCVTFVCANTKEGQCHVDGRESQWANRQQSQVSPSHLQLLLSKDGDTGRGHITHKSVWTACRGCWSVFPSCWSQAWPNSEGYKAKVESFLACWMYWNIQLTVESPPLLHKVALRFTVLTCCFLPCLFILHTLTSLCLHMHSILANIL